MRKVVSYDYLSDGNPFVKKPTNISTGTIPGTLKSLLLIPVLATRSRYQVLSRVCNSIVVLVLVPSGSLENHMKPVSYKYQVRHGKSHRPVCCAQVDADARSIYGVGPHAGPAPSNAQTQVLGARRQQHVLLGLRELMGQIRV